jgi:hypothetical protein
MSIFNASPPTLDTPTLDTSVLNGGTSPFTPNLTNPFEGPVQDFTVNPTPSLPTSSFSSGKYVEQKYNEMVHKIELYLDNSGTFDGNEKKYHINPSAVINLSIIDTINDWVVEGSLTIIYLPDDITPKQKKTLGQFKDTITGAEDNANLLKTYNFRGDGFDLLRVMIAPLPNSSQTKVDDDLKIDSGDPLWYLSYIFSVYDIDDLNEVPGLKGPAASYLKCVRLKFRDARYQILKTTNLEYSTALSPEATIDPNLANGSLGVLPTGKAMLEVFNQALSNPDVGIGALEFFQLPGSEDWDDGAANVFYTSPASYSAADDLDYLYAHHVSSQKELLPGVNDICMLHTKRNDTPELIEPICLTPISKFFEKAGKDSNNPGELQLEHFFITTHSEESIDPSTTFKAPIGGNNKNIDIKTFKYGQIISYSFLDMSPDINSGAFYTAPVYSVDIGKRQFNIQFKNNDVETARKAIAEGYISNLFSGGGTPEQRFLPIIHKTKKNINVFPTFSLNGDNELVRQRNGIHQLLYTGLFQNACICFKTFGLTIRESGTFIGIDKSGGSTDTDYNNKLYGQWFVVKVEHIFEAGAYMNIIYAVKINRFKEIQQDFLETTL